MKRLVIVVALIAAASAAAIMSAIGRAPSVPVAQREKVFDGFPLNRPRVVEFGLPQLESDEPTCMRGTPPVRSASISTRRGGVRSPIRSAIGC